MVIQRRFFAAVTLAFGLACCLAGSAFAQCGGVYLDNIQLKNDGNVAFTENFDSGNISAWYQLGDASLFTVDQKTPSRMLWMNSHGKNTGMAQHKLYITPNGCTELSASVYIAPAAEQYEWQKERFSAFFMSLEYRKTPNSPADSIRIEVILYPKDKGCKVAAKRNSPVVTKFNMTPQPVLSTGKWVLLTLRLDPVAGTATACIDNTPLASVPYDPADFPMFNNLVLSTSFGDGTQQTE